MLKFNQYLSESSICATCETDPCICEDSHGLVSEGAAQHKVWVMVSDPNHTAVTKRKEQVMKRVIVNADDKNHAVVKAKEFYKKKGYKVHDAEYHSPQPKSSMKTESVEEAFADQGSGTTGKSREDTRIAKLLQKKHKQQTPTKEQGVTEGSLTDKQQSYWDSVAKEKKNKERAALNAKKVEHEKTPIGKAEKYWGKKGVSEEVEELDEANHQELLDGAQKAYIEATRKGNGVMAKHYGAEILKHKANIAANIARAKKTKIKEETELHEIATTGMSHQGKKTLKHIKNPTVTQRMAARDIKPGVAGFRDRIDALRDAKARGNLKEEELDLEEVVDEGLADDMLAIAKKRNPNAKIAGNVDQQKKERDDMLKKREADRAGQPKHTPVRDPKHDPEDRGYGSRRYMGDSVEYKEELEQIDELTNKTLNDYTVAANKDFQKAKLAGDSSKMLKRGTGLMNAVGKKIENTVKSMKESIDKDHPIYKEYDSLKKNHDIKSLRNLIKGQHRIIDTSEFKTKDHAISSYLRNKHGDKKVADAFRLKEEKEYSIITFKQFNDETE